MLVVISPAKKLNMQPSENILPTQPIFGDEANELADVMQNLSLDKLQSLMGISENLAKLNADRFAHFGSQDKKPAALAFAGDTYLGLEAASLEPDEMAWCKIICGCCWVSMACCDHLMQLSLIVWKWEANLPQSAGCGVTIFSFKID